MTARIVGTRVIHNGWAKFLIATIRRPDGAAFEREIEDHGRAVAVLPYDPERRVALLARLLRAPVLYAGGSGELLEAPAGLMDEDDPAAAARREALEEVGLRLRALEHVATVWSLPGICTEQMTLYLAPYSTTDRIGPGGGLAEENEDISVVELPLAQLWSLVETRQLADMKTLALVLALKHIHPQLFD